MTVEYGELNTFIRVFFVQLYHVFTTDIIYRFVQLRNCFGQKMQTEFKRKKLLKCFFFKRPFAV